MPKNSTTSAMALAPFRQLTVAWVATNCADSLLFIALAVWVKDLSGSNVMAGMTMVFMGIPALLAPFLGQLADRYRRKPMLVGANAAMVAILAALFTVQNPAHVWIIHAVVFSYSAMNYLTAAAQGGIIRDLLPDSALASGNGILSTIDQSLRLIGPLVGTGLYVAVGPHAVIAVTMVFFLLSALLMARVQVRETHLDDAAVVETRWRELTAGFRHLVSNPPLGQATLLLALSFGATGFVNVAVYPLLEEGLGLPASALGIVMPVQAVGAIFGGLLAVRTIGRFGELGSMWLGITGLIVGLLPTVLTSNRVVVFAGVALLGFSVIVSVVAFATMRQRLTPPRLQGRTGTAANVAINVPQLLGTVTATALVASVNFRTLIWVCITMCTIALVSQVAGRLKS